ncbi:MAG TPA: ThuA domain-containing protein [Puia sp.]|nr:ThuA domain-containing protein [Puia sp.]
MIAFYSTTVERDHVQFARDALAFFTKLAKEKNFQFDSTTDWANTNDAYLKKYQVVIWINEFPHTEEERKAFERYMTGGGAWLGFHVSGYNDRETHWPWIVDFLGGAVFYTNNWPPLPAKLVVDDPNHPVTRNLPASYRSPINEWYQWKPSPRLNKDVKVLLSLDSSNYPIGKKDIIFSGDLPVVWTNTKYKMVYMNMGHGDQVLTEPIQNRMFSDALIWLATGK